MLCQICGKKAIYTDSSGRAFCREHFKQWVEETAKQVLKRYIKKSAKLAVAVSGGKDSTLALLVTKQFASEVNAKVFGIHVDEGISGYRPVTTRFLLDFAEKIGVKIKVISFEEAFGASLDELVKKSKIRACTICGVFRRYLLNYVAFKEKADYLILGHNQDDEVQTLFMNLFIGNVQQIARKGELAKVIDARGFIPRLKPLVYLPEKATMLYNLLFLHVPDVECPYREFSNRFWIRKFVYRLDAIEPGAIEKIQRFYYSKLMPELKKRIKEKAKLKRCKICGFPTSREICKACELRKKLGLDFNLEPLL